MEINETPGDAQDQPNEKKKLIRRSEQDRSQTVRKMVQWSFAALNVYLCAQFYLWARYYETGGATHYFERPSGVDGWLPIAGLMNLKLAISTGQIPAIHPAGMFLFVAFVLISLIFKKTFCSWLCPVGTFSEYLWKGGGKLLGRNVTVPRWLDIPLRGVKYLLLAFFVLIIGRMSAVDLQAFLEQPYGIIADVKMLNFFRHMGQTALVTFGILVLLSGVIKNFWCRYGCPYGALMGLASLLSPTKIRRDEKACVDCGKCAKACPSTLPVDRLVQVRSAECSGCMECVAACPAESALQFGLPSRTGCEGSARWQGRSMKPWAVGAGIAVLFFGIVGYARVTGHWKTVLPQSVYMELVPHANDESHPGW